MGRIFSSLKVSAHLEVVGECGGADRLTLCLPRSRGKGGRRLLVAFSFPSAGKGAGQHYSGRILVPIGKVAKKDGNTPVRVDFLAGESLVARREIPLADLLVGLKANRIGRHSSLFFSLKAGQGDDAAVAVYYSRMLLDEPKLPQEDQQEPGKADQHASLPPQAGETNTSLSHQAGVTKLILPPYAVHTNSSDTVATLTPEVSYRDLTPKVMVVDLVDGQRWATPQAQSLRERKDAPQAGQTVASLTPEVVHRGHGDGQRWVTPQAQLRHRRGEPHGRLEGVVLQPSTPSLSKKGKEAPRGGKGGACGCLCGPCLVVSLLQCAQAMSFTVLLYHLWLEWF